MTDHYIEDLEQLYNIDSGLSLPNLDITDDDLNTAAQSNGSINLNEKKECSATAAKDIELNDIYSPYSTSVADSYDCASMVTTGTEESYSEDTDCHTRSLKSKRNRSLSSSSSLNSRRKRRFSSRSSVNSSDSMSDNSSLDSATSSRCSSPERTLNLSTFGSFVSHNSLYYKNSRNYPKYHQMNKSHSRKQLNWINKFGSKYMKPKKKMKVIDFSTRNFNSSSHKGLSNCLIETSDNVTNVITP